MTESPEELRLVKQSRQAAMVIFVTMLVWIGAQWVGGQMGWPVRFAFLFDLAAGAAFIWALVVLFRVWRQRRNNGER
ncbi:MAG: DUF5337 domain-containing protein [Paracoccaceae bacterium]